MFGFVICLIRLDSFQKLLKTYWFFFCFIQVVTVLSLAFSILSCISLCTRTTCWRHWAPTCKNTYGGRSIWPVCRWCNSWLSWSMLSNYYSLTVIIQKLSFGGLACTQSCSSSCSRSSINSNTWNRQRKR